MSTMVSAEIPSIRAQSPSLGESVVKRLSEVAITAYPLVALGLVWEFVARLDVFPSALFPTLTDVISAMYRLTMRGELQLHFLATVWRLLAGFVVASVIAVPIGLMMARSNRVEGFFLPVMTFLNPIPGLAWVPLFLVWFSLGNQAVIALVIWSSVPPIVINTWTGAKTINEIWVRAAQSMGARGPTLYRKVVMPGALPFVLSGMRIGLSRGWRAVIAAELLSAGGSGLGFMIFAARDFMRTDVMLAGVFAIGLAGVLLEKVLFQVVEKHTVVRWGMLRDSNT